MDGRIIRNFAHYYIMYRTTNNNDIDKMRRLYEQFYDRLFLYARTFLDDVEESRDVVSETFQTVWERWQNDVRDPGSSYLYTIVRNRCLDRLRRSKLPSTIGRRRFIVKHSVTMRRFRSLKSA